MVPRIWFIANNLAVLTVLGADYCFGPHGFSTGNGSDGVTIILLLPTPHSPAHIYLGRKGFVSSKTVPAQQNPKSPTFSKKS